MGEGSTSRPLAGPAATPAAGVQEDTPKTKALREILHQQRECRRDSAVTATATAVALTAMQQQQQDFEARLQEIQVLVAQGQGPPGDAKEEGVPASLPDMGGFGTSRTKAAMDRDVRSRAAAPDPAAAAVPDPDGMDHLDTGLSRTLKIYRLTSNGNKKALVLSEVVLPWPVCQVGVIPNSVFEGPVQFYQKEWTKWLGTYKSLNNYPSLKVVCMEWSGMEVQCDAVRCGAVRSV